MFEDSLTAITSKFIEVIDFIFETITNFIFGAILGFIFRAIAGFIFRAIDLLHDCSKRCLLQIKIKLKKTAVYLDIIY